MNEHSKTIDSLRFGVPELARVIELVNAKELSSTNAKAVIQHMGEHGGDPDAIVDEKKLRQKNDMAALESIVNEVIAANTSQIQDYQSGNERIF